MPNLPTHRLGALLGCTIPIVLAGMGGVARSELVAAVTEAGGFGFLGMVREPPELIEREVKALRQRGIERFGVNIIPATTSADLLEKQVALCIALKVPVMALFWDIDAALVARLKAAGIVVVYQVGSVDEAIAAERAGADIIIAQGREAGGHVRGKRRLRELLQEVINAVTVPVLAAGGLATGGDLITAQALGAEGIVLGTALMATDESFAHDYHKQRLLGAKAADTVLTEDFHINWPVGAAVRVIKNDVTSGAKGSPHAGEKIVIGEEEGRPIYLFSTDSPLRSMTGDFALMALYAGTGVEVIDAIVGARARLETIAGEAEAYLAPADDGEASLTTSPVCYAGEVGGAYMGLLGETEIATALADLASEMRAALELVLADLPDGVYSGEPTFSQTAYDYAKWCLLLGESGNAKAAQATLEPLRAQMLQRLTTLLPGVPEGALQRQLVRLRRFLGGQGGGGLLPYSPGNPR